MGIHLTQVTTIGKEVVELPRGWVLRSVTDYYRSRRGIGDCMSPDGTVFDAAEARRELRAD